MLSLYVLHSGHYLYRQFNTQQFHVLPTQLYLCVLYGSENKQRLFPYTALTDWFIITETERVYCAVRTGYLYILDNFSFTLLTTRYTYSMVQSPS